MKNQFIFLVFVVSLTSVFCDKVKDETTSTTTSRSPLLSSIDNIITKVQSMKDTIGKSRHDRLIAKGYRFTPEIGYHNLYLTKLSWYDALKQCRKEMAHLAVIDSSAEREAIGQLVKEKLEFELEFEIINAFVGMHEYCTNGSWITIFFDILNNPEYLKWKQEPRSTSNFSSSPNCAIINEEGLLSTLKCSTPLAFICEVGLN